MSVPGQLRRFGCSRVTSGSSQRTDIAQPARLVRFAPIPEVPSLHSITSTTASVECLLFPLKDHPSDSHLSGVLRTGYRWCFNEQLAILYPPIAPLLGAVPRLVPRYINGGHKVLALDAVLAA